MVVKRTKKNEKVTRVVENDEDEMLEQENDDAVESVKPLGMEDDRVATRLLEKNYSPMFVRKYQYKGWPVFVGIIMDVSASDFDNVFYNIADSFELTNDIQSIRNFVGYVSNGIIEHYNGIKRGSVESVAIYGSFDKLVVSSLYGDAMTHQMCRDEFYSCINTMPHM